MADTNKRAPGSQKLLGYVGLTLFLMGIATYGLVHFADTPDTQTVRLAAGVGVLMSLGVSTILVGAIRRLEARVQALESRREP